MTDKTKIAALTAAAGIAGYLAGQTLRGEAMHYLCHLEKRHGGRLPGAGRSLTRAFRRELKLTDGIIGSLSLQSAGKALIEWIESHHQVNLHAGTQDRESRNADEWLDGDDGLDQLETLEGSQEPDHSVDLDESDA